MGGFNLTKGATNDHEVLESIPLEERSKDVKAKSFMLNAIHFPCFGCVMVCRDGYVWFQSEH